jgi:hypothetical protein
MQVRLNDKILGKNLENDLSGSEYYSNIRRKSVSKNYDSIQEE